MDKRIKVVFDDKEYEIPLGTKVKHVRDIELLTREIAPEILDLAQTNEGNWLFRLMRGCVVFAVLMDSGTGTPETERYSFEKIFWGSRSKMIDWLKKADFDLFDKLANEIVSQFDVWYTERAKYIRTDGLYFEFIKQEAEKKSEEKTIEPKISM
jgi:hypothetical protein